MSVLQKIQRSLIFPLSIITILIGIAGYVFTAYSANQLKIDETTGIRALIPSAVSADLWSTVRGLENYIQYRETGQVVTYSQTYSSVRLVTDIPRYRSFSYQSEVLEIFVPAMYHNQPPALLRDVLKNFKTRRDIAVIQREAAEVYWTLIVAGGATGLFLLLLPVAIGFGRRIPFSKIWSTCVRSWRKLMVLGSVVWAVLATLATNPSYSSEYAIIIGPFVIALTIYFLFPQKKMYPSGTAENRNADMNQDSQ